MTPSGDSAYPYRFERTAMTGELARRWETLEPGTDSGETAAVAGRLRSLRSHGKAAFADLEDPSGRVQLFGQLDVLGEEGFESFTRLGVGDIVGAEGEVIRTRRGELSVRVSTVILLAECLRSMPEKWHGMSDVEARYRQRYLDLIVNPEARRIVAARATLNTAARRFLEERGFVEVETPLLHHVASGAVARPFVTHHNSLDLDLYLRIAPELYLKRLLIGGVERVYELNRSFRNEGVSARHNPEFTMLEAYQAFADYEDIMSLVEDLVKEIALVVTGSLRIEIQGQALDLEEPFERITMFEAIARTTGADLEPLWKGSEPSDPLRAIARELDVELRPEWGPGKIVAAIFEARAERSLMGPTYVVGFPKEVSPLAKDHRSIEGFTEHTDLILGGVEIAPMYSELNDPAEQERRFTAQAAAQAWGEHEVAMPDAEFLEALAYGMPPAGGFGLGIDRLLMFLLGSTSLREVILFPAMRPEAPGPPEEPGT
ncbi:MAG: lysine--tRNA ligase [Actinomycetota bacterium]|nr:lysine--tRNA ligase [Actinomycetota bacterium]